VGLCSSNAERNIVQARVKQGQGFTGPEVEEARSCLFTLQQAKDSIHTDIIVDGDCIGVIQVLKSRIVHDNSMGLIVKDILTLADSFSLFLVYVKRGGNRVAHDLAHWQPFSFSSRTWDIDVLDAIVSWASKDMFAYVDSNLI